MAPKLRNIAIFVSIAAIFALIYIFFIKPSPDQDSLVSTSNASLPNLDNTETETGAPDATSLVAKDFLTLLLSVKSIKLNDAIFSDVAFNSLRDSSITLTPDGTEGRVNPFAKLGSDAVSTSPPASSSSTSSTSLDGGQTAPPAQTQ